MLFEESKKDHELQKDIFTKEDIKNIGAFFDILKRIHVRLATEGYVISDGLISKPTVELPNNNKDGNM